MSRDDNRLKHGSKKLGQEVKKRMTTTIVGIIASFEKHFEHRFPENYDKATDEEIKFEAEFSDFREEAFDKGNHQLRELLKELELYDVEYVGYQVEFHKKEQK